MIKNRAVLFALVSIALAGALGCSPESGETNSQPETTGLEKYVQQASPKLDALVARHKEMMQQIGNSLRQGSNKSYHYNRETVSDQTAKMGKELDRAQQDFRAMTIPKSGESFANNIMQLILNERIFIEKLENAFKSESQEIPEAVWAELTASAELTPRQKGLLIAEMLRVSGATANANGK
jgi:hypothetical protein